MQTERINAVKRKLFDRVYDNLNERQREAVYTVNGPLLILAGAGSGKTTVLVNRIAYMIRYGNAYFSDHIPEDFTDGDLEALEAVAAAPGAPKEYIEKLLDRFAYRRVKAWGILSITFTNKAAGEMKTRLESKVGDAAKDIWAGTFHSMCVRILRRFGDKVGYSDGFTIYDTDDQKKVMLDVIRDCKVNEKMFTPKAVLAYVSSAKDKLMSPEDCRAESKDYRSQAMAELYKEYQIRLKRSNALDFDDIITETVRLLKENEDVREYYQDKFRYVCVDEYQDTNHAQFELTALLSGKYRNIMVVGDDDQSIYRFRGADIKNILEFDKTISDAKVIRLEQNYRSTGYILDAANAIIKHNEGRHDKTLFTERQGGEKVSLSCLDDQNAEAKFIVDTILELKRSEGRSLSDFAVLYRLNALSNSLESAFARSGIPYRILGGLRFYERKEIKDILAYLCVINNPSDSVRLKRIINEPKRKIGDSTVEAVQEIANLENTTMFDVMRRSGTYESLSRNAERLTAFTSMILGLRDIAEAEPLDVVIDRVLDLTGYRMMLEAEGESGGKERLENVSELISNAVEFCAAHEDCSLGAFLEEVALVADIDNYDPSAEAVVLMTIHSAKGLEFPVVFLPALEESVFPSQQALYEPEELEEERRLAYVAVTRAKDRLYLTHTRNRLLYGKTQYNELSRYVGEIPSKLLDNNEKNSDYTFGQNSPLRRSFVSDGFRASGVKQEAQKPTVPDEISRKPNISGIYTQKSGKAEVFSVGDMVTHTVFGEGLIISAKNMGGDVLYEIAFDSAGTKKMMGSYAKIKRLEK